MSTISINYDRAYREANRLKTTASECDTIISQSRQALADLNLYWEGAAATEFLAVNEKWRKEMESIKTELTTISNLIKKVTDDIREADRRAAAAVRSS